MYKFFRFPSTLLLSAYIVTPLIVSLNFCCLTKLLKKLTSEVLKNDLAKSWDLGTIIVVNNICIIINKIESLKIKLIIFIL